MANNIKYSTGLANHLQGTGSMKEAFPNTAKLHLYSGSGPASPDDEATGDLLASLSITDFDGPVAGVLTSQGSFTGNGLAAAGTGTLAGYFRLCSDPDDDNSQSSSALRAQGPVGVSGSGKEVTLDNPVVSEGTPIILSNNTIAQ